MTVSISLTITSTGLSSPSVSRYSRPSPFILRASGRRPARRAEMHGEEDERNVSDETNVERRGVNQTDEPALRVTRRSLRSLLTCPEGGFAASFVASHPACGAEGKGVG